MKLTRDTSEEVKTLRQFIDPKTEDPLLLSDISKFMEFGGRKIKFTSDEVRATQKSLLWGSFGLKLICFKQQSQLRWSDFVRSSNFIYPDETVIKGSRNLFSALLNRCQEKNVIPICRLVALISNFIFVVRYYFGLDLNQSSCILRRPQNSVAFSEYMNFKTVNLE